MQSEKKHFKVLVVGDPETGKTELCLHAAYPEGTQRPSASPTVGMNMHLLSNNNSNHPIVLTLWDCAGFQIHMDAIRNRIRESSGFIVVYDVGNRSSFENLQKWLALIKENAQQSWIGELIANVKDSNSKREVSIEEGVKFAQKYGFNFREISVLDTKMVKSFFSSLFDKFFLKEQPKIGNLNPIIPKDLKPQTKSGTSSKPKEEPEKKDKNCTIF